MANESTPKKIACVRPWHSTFSNREFKVCCWQKTSLGALDKNSSLESLWNSPGAEEIRRDMFNAPDGEVPDKHCPKICGGRIPSDEALEEYRDVALSGATKIALPPHEMTFEVDHACNLRCKMCWIFESLEYAQSLDGIRNVLYGVHERQLKHRTSVNLLGGEPFFSKNCRALVQTIIDENLDLRLSFISNLTIFDSGLLERIRTNGIGSFTISFDAGTKKTYESIRKNADFESVIGNIKKLCEYRFKRSRELRELHWEINVPSIVMTSNFEEMDQTFDLFKDLPVFLLFVPINRAFRPRSQEQVFDFVPPEKADGVSPKRKKTRFGEAPYAGSLGLLDTYPRPVQRGRASSEKTRIRVQNDRKPQPLHRISLGYHVWQKSLCFHHSRV